MTGEGKEAWVVRRTDQNTDPAKNNPFMFFMIDNGYVKGDQSYQVKITVKYFDIGTDKWQLKYDSTSGEKAAVAPDGKNYIQKTGTKQLKEVTFTIADGKFAGRLTGGADFYLDSRAPDGTLDGNEWVHMVDVAKQGSLPESRPIRRPSRRRPLRRQPPPSRRRRHLPRAAWKALPLLIPTVTLSKDPSEPGLPGAVMVLKLFGTNTESYTATSDANGVYRFAAVAPGQYTLSEKSPPPGYFLNTLYFTDVPGAGE